MADNETETDTAAEAAAAAASATVLTIARVEDAAAVAIANAGAQLDAAHAVAEQITEAALQREIGIQVTAIREDVSRWRAEQENQTTRLTALELSLMEVQTRLTEVNSALANQSLSIQQPPLIVPVTEEAGQVLQGAETPLISPRQVASDENTVEEVPLQIQRKRRFV